MSLCVHHYYPLGTPNVGDRLVAHALREAVSRHFGPHRFVEFPVNDRYPVPGRLPGLQGENLLRTNAEADLVLMGGSNLLEARKRGRWGVMTDVGSIARLDVPLLLLGMGSGSDFGRGIRRFSPPAIDEVRALHAKAFASAVRDQRTVLELARIGVRTLCTGCPVTFLSARAITAQPDEAPLLISFPPPRIERQWGGRHFMRKAMEYFAWVQDRGIPVFATLHDGRDLEFARQRLPEGMGLFTSNDSAEHIARFEHCRGVIGFRLHAALLGWGLGKPAIPVGLDWRGLGFQTTFGLQNLSIRPFRPGQFSKLRSLTLRLIAGDPDLLAQEAAAKQRFALRYETFLRSAAAHFKALPPPRRA